MNGVVEFYVVIVLISGIIGYVIGLTHQHRANVKLLRKAGYLEEAALLKTRGGPW